jgi:hypothetical protein
MTGAIAALALSVGLLIVVAICHDLARERRERLALAARLDELIAEIRARRG